MPDLLVGIDVGSQSAKVDVLDLTGAVVGTGQRRLLPLDTSGPGRAEHPGDDLWDALTEACRTALDGVPASRVAGVGLCGIRYTRALLRADGTLAAPVLSWMDERVSRPYAGQDPAVRWVTASSGYLAARLTGEVRDSAAAYHGQWPIDLATWDWFADDDALAAYGVPREHLATLVPPGASLGDVTASAAAATGLPAGVPVVGTANDKAVEALGCGLSGDDEVLLSLGTYVGAMTVGASLVQDASSFWTNFGAVPARYLYESTGGVRRGMWTVSWLRELVGAGLGADPARTLEDAAARLPPGAEGLLTVLDWLAPPDEPWRRGAFVGFDGRHGPGHLHRSVLEALALTMARHTAAMTAELGRVPVRLVLSGGGASSPTMRRIAADAFDLPVVVAGGGSPAARGAAIAAGVHTGLFTSYDEGVAALVRRGPALSPEEPGRSAYEALAPVHAALADALAPTYRRTQEALDATPPTG